MKMFAHRDQGHTAPLVYIADAEPRHIYFSIGSLRRMKAMLDVKTPHYAFIGEQDERFPDCIRISSGPHGEGIIHELYRAELALLPRIRFQLFKRWYAFDIAHRASECPIYIGTAPRRRLVSDVLLWLAPPCAPFAPLNILNVEVRDTHRIPEDKDYALRDAGVPTIEIEVRRHVRHDEILSTARIDALRHEVRRHLAELNYVRAPKALPFLKGWDTPFPGWLDILESQPFTSDPWLDACTRAG